MLINAEPYGVAADEKQPLLLQELQQLHRHHLQHCPAYFRLVQAQWPELLQPMELQNCAQLPYLTARLFKQLELQSVPTSAVFKVLNSSGTTGQPSRIVLDAATAQLQSKVLVKILQHWLGKARLPMLIIDHPEVVKDRSNFSARGAGILGLSFMGRQHCYALNPDMSLNWPALQSFCQQFGDGPVLVFGFTFMIWQHFIQQLQQQQRLIHLPGALLLHSGGWKKLQQQAVDNATFKQQVQQMTAISQIHNFYGMVEQTGTIFVECEQGHLHCPTYADVIVRHPGTWQTQPQGEEGVLELLSITAASYPGSAILTEDCGTLLGEDDCLCGRKGKYFRVSGRLPQAEVRGCSDTFSPPLPGAEV